MCELKNIYKKINCIWMESKDEMKDDRNDLERRENEVNIIYFKIL